MIFVTVGTHEQPFYLLIQYMDDRKREELLDEEIVIQTGYSTYEPKYCTWQRLYPYKKMMELIDEARIVITHGGPSSFIMPLQIGKIPIVVPRQKKFNEHVNDHQVYFTQEVANRNRNILTVINIEELDDIIINYDRITKSMQSGNHSNNAKFNAAFEKIVDEMFEERY